MLKRLSEIYKSLCPSDSKSKTPDLDLKSNIFDPELEEESKIKNEIELWHLSTKRNNYIVNRDYKDDKIKNNNWRKNKTREKINVLDSLVKFKNIKLNSYILTHPWSARSRFIVIYDVHRLTSLNLSPFIFKICYGHYCAHFELLNKSIKLPLLIHMYDTTGLRGTDSNIPSYEKIISNRCSCRVMRLNNIGRSDNIKIEVTATRRDTIREYITLDLDIRKPIDFDGIIMEIIRDFLIRDLCSIVLEYVDKNVTMSL